MPIGRITKILDVNDYDRVCLNSIDFTTLNTCVSTVGSSSLTILVSSAITLSANLVVPSNVEIIVTKSGSINLGNYNLTINGAFQCGLYQAFISTGGKVTFGYSVVTEVYPEWWQNNSSPGVTDMSYAVSAATLCGVGKVKFSNSWYKFSVNIEPKFGCLWEGNHSQTMCVPLSTTQPCFIFRIDETNNSSFFMQLQFKNIRFKDGANSQTGTAVWSTVNMSFDHCTFEGLKYGVVGNCCEWTKYQFCYWSGCFVGCYYTTAWSNKDPIGLSPRYVDGNPSEHYFSECWFNVNDVHVYEEQPENIWDRATNLHFFRVQFMGGKCGIVVRDSQASAAGVYLKESWFEGRNASTEVDVTIGGRVIKNSIVNLEGCSLNWEETLGLYNNDIISGNYIYMYPSLNRVIRDSGGTIVTDPNIWYGRLPNSGLTVTYTTPVTASNNTFAIFKKQSYTGSFKRIFNIDDSIIVSFEDFLIYENGGNTISRPIFAKNLLPAQGDTQGVMWNSTSKLHYNRMAYNNIYKNIAGVGATCTVQPLTINGTATTSIVSGGGVFGKYMQITNCLHNSGISLAFNMNANKCYYVSFNIFQNTGMNRDFFIEASQFTLASFGFPTVKSNKWTQFSGIVGTKYTGAGWFILKNRDDVSPATIDFALSAFQIIEFDTYTEASIFADSGIYCDPISP